jgi:hypothetical protein
MIGACPEPGPAFFFENEKITSGQGGGNLLCNSGSMSDGFTVVDLVKDPFSDRIVDTIHYYFGADGIVDTIHYYFGADGFVDTIHYDSESETTGSTRSLLWRVAGPRRRGLRSGR